MKITFVSPYNKNIWESLGIAYIASYLKKNFNEKLDLSFFHGNFDSEEEIIKGSITSDILMISCTTPTFNNGYDIAKKVKKINSSIKVIFGGWHPTSTRVLPDNVIDFVVKGEGEKIALDIINNVYSNNTIICNNTPISFSKLPWPDRELVKQDRMLELCNSMCGERIGSVQSIRGCKFRCKMCSEKCMTGNFSLRVRDPEDTLDEIEYLIKDYKVNRIKFCDATWAISEEVVTNFCEAKLKRNLDIKFDVMLHAGIATENMIKIMAKANCDVFMVGVESGDQRILNDIHKGTTISKIKKVFEWGKKYGINRRAFFILGTDLESIESINKTRQLINSIEPDVVGFTILTPFPGNDYYRDEFKNVDWSNCDEYSNDFYYCKNFTNQQLKEIQKKLNTEFKHILVSHQRD